MTGGNSGTIFVDLSDSRPPSSPAGNRIADTSRSSGRKVRWRCDSGIPSRRGFQNGPLRMLQERGAAVAANKNRGVGEGMGGRKQESRQQRY